MSEFSIPLRSLPAVSLMTAGAACDRPGSFPTSRIQKGLVLAFGGQDLSEEGVGFCVPLLKVGLEVVFPGSVVWKIESREDVTVEAEFSMNLVGRMVVKGRRIDFRTFYRAREYLASQYREHPWLRKGILYCSELSRRVMSMRDAFEEVPSLGSVKTVYTVKDSEVRVNLDLREISECSELVIMNEQGANHFDSYKDSDGLFLEKDAIGGWDEVCAGEASFIDSKNGLYFALPGVEGTRMMRGRELLSGRLAWAGLAYVLSPGMESFSYTIRLGRA